MTWQTNIPTNLSLLGQPFRVKGKVFVPTRFYFPQPSEVNAAIYAPESSKKMGSATLTIGRKITSARDGVYPRGHTLSPPRLARFVESIRHEQIGARGGGTVIPASGWWYDHKGKKIPESSAQAIIFPAPRSKRRRKGQTVKVVSPESWRKFKSNIKNLAIQLVERLPQDEVFVRFERGGRIDEVGSAFWRDPNPKRRKRRARRVR